MIPSGGQRRKESSGRELNGKEIEWPFLTMQGGFEGVQETADSGRTLWGENGK